MGGSPGSISRRTAIVAGAVLVSSMSLPASAVTAGPSSNDVLAELGQTFARLRRRWTRQGRHVRQLAARADDLATSRGIAPVGRRKRQRAALDAIREEVGYHAAWALWSATYDELAALADQISPHPASTSSNLAVRFAALQWLLLDDGAVVDQQAARRCSPSSRATRTRCSFPSLPRQNSIRLPTCCSNAAIVELPRLRAIELRM